MSKAFQSPTAILFFSRSLEAEIENKTLLKKTSFNSTCISSLQRHVSKEITKSKLPIFSYDESVQKGYSFGERIANAFQDLFDQGYSNIIALGNDCPNLSVRDIKNAESVLHKKNIVLGPDQHGGAFLIGLSSKIFDKGQFQSLDWQTSNLISSFKNYADIGSTSIAFIDQKIDLNTKEDLLKFSTICFNLYHILVEIFLIHFFYLVVDYASFDLNQINIQNRRGPPCRILAS